MESNRESRRASVVSSNGFNRRRYRTNSLRDSPDEDMAVELQESVRLRDRVKKDRDRERDRERDLRERPSRSVKRRRNERSTNNRGNDEGTSDESVNVEEEDDDEEEEDGTTTAAANHHRDNSSSFSRNTNSNHNNIANSTVAHHLQHGRSFPPPTAASKAFRPPPVWRSGDEVINVSVPRKARSSSTKRSHDWISSSSNNNSGGVGGGEQIIRQASDSPARQGAAAVSTPNQPPATSPSSLSSHPSIRKKLRHAGNNNIGPKPKPSRLSSSNPEELEIEIAEVLYGLKTQGPSSSSSCKKEDINRSSSEAKSHHSSPISNATFKINGPNRSSLTAVAPKRKRPRQVAENPSYGVQISSITAKEADQTPKIDISSPSNVDKVLSEMEGNSVTSQAQASQPSEPTAQVLDTESRPLASVLRDDTSNRLSEEEILSQKEEKESAVVRVEGGIENEASASLTTSKFSKVEAQTEEKYEIDLMAPPPQLRSSTERETVLDSNSVAADPKPFQSAVNMDLTPTMISGDSDEDGSEKLQERKRKEAESSSVKASESNGLRINLQLDLEKPERDESDGGVNAVRNKLPDMPPKAVREDHVPERHAQSTSSVLLPLSVPSWPSGFPPMGYMAAPPLQGVAPMDGATATSAPIPPPLLLSQPRSKRCATHCQIARNIHYQQQFMKMNPFWAGSPLFGPRPSNLNVIMPDSNLAVKGLANAPQNPSNAAPVKIGMKRSLSETSHISDSLQKKQQVLFQQALPPHVTPNNLMDSAFIFPLSQQQAALSARPGNEKPATTAPSSVANVSSPETMQMPFNYPNLGPNEPQYLAILQNNGYPFPLPPGFRGPPGHPMPVFYPPQMIHHPSQLLQQQQQQQQPQSSVSQDGNASNSSSSSQKQQRAPESAGNVSFASSHDNQKHSSMSRPRQAADGDMKGYETSSRFPPAVNLYGQNFGIHPQNFALMTPSSAAAAYGVSSSQHEKKTNQTQQQQQGVVVKNGVESLTPHHGFAMSFGPGIDMSSMVQNHQATFKSSPDVTRQMMSSAAAAAAQKKNVRVSEDGKSNGGGDSSNATTYEDERKVQSQATIGQSITFARSDFLDNSSHARGSRASSASVNAHSIQSQIQQQQILHLKHQQQQQQLAAANRGSKGPHNGSIFPDHLNSSSSSTTAAKFPVMQMSMNNSQSSQWKGSSGTRPSASPQVVVHQPPPLGSSSSSTFKGVLQQSCRSQPPEMHTQISFGGNHNKPNTSAAAAAAASQGQGLSAPMMSSNSSTTSKGAIGGSSTTNSKMSQGSSPNSSTKQQQHRKNSPSSSSMLQSQKSPSILGNPQLNSSSNSGAKAQIVNSQQQQMMAKNMQHAQQQLFSNPFGQIQSFPTSNNTTCAAGVYFMNQQPKRTDKNQHQAMTCSNGMLLSLTTTTSSTTDPAKAATAAATGNGKSGGGSLPSASQFGAQPGGTALLTGFPYAQPVIGGRVQTKPTEQKQQPAAAGNETPEKK